MPRTNRTKRPRRQKRGEGQDRFGKEKFVPTKLRIVSGEHRGRKVAYNGDPATRPMKERTREAVFSLLGGKFDGELCIDLFGGTGILAMETYSRGAASALVLELSRAAVTTIVENLESLGIGEYVRVLNVDTLRWLRDAEANMLDFTELEYPAWIVFACPPYRLWTAESERIVEGLRGLMALAPTGSQLVCETDQTFSIAEAIPEWDWDVRHYDPAYISVVTKS
ncbi:MAG: RsmD family RNA methyltransferase [Aureliella sp.]